MKKTMMFLCVGLLFFSTACSRLDMAFKSADMFLAFRVDDYFDISSQQKKDLKANFKKDLERLKKESLPELSAQLKRVDQDLERNALNEERLTELVKYSMTTMEEVLSQFSGTTQAFVGSLKPEQFIYFEKASEKKLAEERETVRDQGDFLKKGRKTYARWLEMFFGDLTRDQKALLDQHLMKTTYFYELKIKNKESFLKKIKAGKNSPEMQKQLVISYYSDKGSQDIPEFSQGQKQFEKDLEIFLSQLIQSLSPSQKAKLKANILDKARQLDRLAS
ncbi:hypothetical protein D3C87_163760 [compost metagenome]